MAEITIACRNGMVPAKPVVDDDEDDAPGRILTVEEFMERLRNRTDIFGVEKSHRLRNAEVVALLFGLAAGFFGASREPSIPIKTDGYEGGISNSEPAVSISVDAVDRTRPPSVINKPAVDVEGRPALRRPKPSVADNSSSSGSTGGGSISGRVVMKGVLGILTGAIKGRDVSTGDPNGLGGFVSGIDVIFSGVHGIKKGGSAGATRSQGEQIGFGPGYSSGFNGDGSGGVDGLINSLMQPAGCEPSLANKTGPPGRLISPEVKIPERGVSLGDGGRSRAEIMRVVLQNISALRYAYNQRLREKPGLDGSITIKFAIDEFGRVIACEVLSTSMNDQQLEAAIRGKIFRWTFDTINKPGDITEVVYPFVFST